MSKMNVIYIGTMAARWPCIAIPRMNSGSNDDCRLRADIWEGGISYVAGLGTLRREKPATRLTVCLGRPILHSRTFSILPRLPIETMKEGMK